MQVTVLKAAKCMLYVDIIFGHEFEFLEVFTDMLQTRFFKKKHILQQSETETVPVSYTHLDVYKRQLSRLSLKCLNHS